MIYVHLLEYSSQIIIKPKNCGKLVVNEQIMSIIMMVFVIHIEYNLKTIINI